MLVKHGVWQGVRKKLKTKEVKEKMRTLKRVGSVAAGAVMLGAAISGAVSAGLDDTGLTEDFFYDSGYNPIVQIVVGEKGMATDSVAAGNIAAVIGNLAYTSGEAAVSGGSSSGAVVLGISARGATGKFEQSWNPSSSNTRIVKVNRNADSNYDVYNDNEGIYFNQSSGGSIKGTGGIETYTRGEFVSYSLACDQQERTEAGILKKGTYNNVHCLFCQTLCLSQLENPEHEMEESIAVDYNKIMYFEDGLGKDEAEELVLKIKSKAVTYILDAGFIPMNKIETGTGTSAETIDFEWRGQFILFGEEFYVKDISGTDKIYLAKGKILDDISSEGYTSEYMGYKFKIDHLIYSAEYEVAGILLDVEKPDGTVVQTQISKMANGIVDDIEIAGVYAEEADAVATASIIVYDTTTNVLLEDGKDMEFGGEVKKYWKVTLTTARANATTVDVSDYESANGAGIVLSNVTIQYRHSIELGVGEALEFPSTYKLMWDGLRTNDYVVSPCSGAGEGDILIERDEKYKMLISFTGDDGQRYNAVRMDQGPFDEGDMFIVDGAVYEYDSSEELTTDTTVRRLTLKDLLNGGKRTYDLDAIGQTTTFTLYTYAFEDAVSNRETLTIEPDSERNDSDVYVGAGPNQYLLYDGGDLYVVFDAGGTALTYSNAGALLDQELIGVNQYAFSGSTGSTQLQKFEMDDNKMYVTVLNEAENDTSADRDGDVDDRLVVLQNVEGEYVIIDMYDRDFNDSAQTYYSENVLVAGIAPSTLALTKTGTGSLDYAYRWQDEEDTLVIAPEGGTTVTIDYGGSRDVEAVTVCALQDIVYPTIFIGTSEQATTIDTTITKDDEGTEKTVGCCTYLIKEFGVTTSGVSAESVVINPIVGNLVVPEIAADTTKNLVVVGGPAVNGLSGLTKDEIQSASGQYVVKKDGNKVYVAGWTAADTVDAGNALIAWLQDNVHA